MSKRLIILFSFVLFVHSSFGQEKVDWAKYDCAAFKEDTTRGFISTAYYTKADCAPFSDITKSDAIFELRVVPTSKVLLYSNRPISIFQFYKDSAILAEYYRDTDTAFENFRKQYRDSSNEAFAKGVTPLLEKNCGINWRVNKKNLSQSEASKIIEDLSQMNLFTIDTDSEIEAIEKRINNDARYSAVLKTHQLNKGPVNYRYSVSLEIKYKNKYRVFLTGGIYYYYDIDNRMQDIGGFIIGAELLKYLKP
ncbi:MAG TPA: hypothetical protein VK492_20285 [Chitinophagaceae bacterium]|jgi:hypothetical protein|nr:hypothetical protein [Chitinophagaceae bacterium]